MIIPVTQLENYTHNPRSITPERYQSLKDGITLKGQYKSIIVTPSDNIGMYTVLGGNMRLKALKELGIPDALCTVVDFYKDENGIWRATTTSEFKSSTKEGYATKEEGLMDWCLADNSEYGYTDATMFANEMSAFPGIDLGKYAVNFEEVQTIADFIKGIAPEVDVEEDQAPEVDETVPPVSLLGEVYQLGRHRLMCGDSTKIEDVEKLMNGQKADMVFTDPPYGIDEQTDRAYAARSRISEGGKFDKIIGDTSTETAIEAYNLCETLNIPIMVFWGANYYCHSLPESGNWLVWDKRIEDKQRDFNSDCELAWVKSKNNSVRIFRHLWKGLIKGSENGEARIHPTQKPIALGQFAFSEYGKENDNVLDLFGGSGSTLIACEQLDRTCYMMELDPKYCDVIRKRYANFVGSGDNWEEVTKTDDLTQGYAES